MCNATKEATLLGHLVNDIHLVLQSVRIACGCNSLAWGRSVEEYVLAEGHAGQLGNQIRWTKICAMTLYFCLPFLAYQQPHMPGRTRRRNQRSLHSN